MKKTILLFAVITSLFLTSCSNEETQIENSKIQKEFKSSDNNLITRTFINLKNNKINKNLNDLGIKKVTITESGEKIIYKLNTNSKIIINDVIYNLGESNFIFENNKFFLEGKSEFITLEDNKILHYLNNGNIVQNEITKANENIMLLDIIYSSLCDNNSIITSKASARPCDAANQFIIVGWGMTSGGAIADLNAGIISQQNAGNLDCTPLDSTPRMGTALGGTIVTATKSFCCDGRGGAGGSW